MASVGSWIASNVGTLLAVAGIIVAWIIYRAGPWNERRGVIRGLEAELDMHGTWVGSPYGDNDRGSWPNPDYMVYKLATVATDNAIARGPSLFLNTDLTIILVRYRQVVGHLNQLIDKAMDFQANPELWDGSAPPDMVKSAIQLIESIHIQGIGDLTLAYPAGAHAFYKIVMTQLDLEKKTKVLPVIWALTGINLFFLKGTGKTN